MFERERLPNRRAAEVVDFEQAGRPWTLTIAGSPMAESEKSFSTRPRPQSSERSRRKARSSRASRYKAGVLLKHSAMPSPEEAQAPLALPRR
jgi:hypothetical protein